MKPVQNAHCRDFAFGPDFYIFGPGEAKINAFSKIFSPKCYKYKFLSLQIRRIILFVQKRVEFGGNMSEN